MADINLEDNPQTIEVLRSMECMWSFARSMPYSQRSRFFAAFAECSDALQGIVMCMLRVVENTETTAPERQRMLMAIADALFLNPAEQVSESMVALVAAPDSGAAPKPLQLAADIGTTDTLQSAFALRLRALMDAKQVSQQELADRFGCSQPAISLMLNRQCRPQKKTILRLAEALKIEPRELWPDLEVAELLDATASFQSDDYSMSEAEAKALRDTSGGNMPTIPARKLPKRNR